MHRSRLLQKRQLAGSSAVKPISVCPCFLWSHWHMKPTALLSSLGMIDERVLWSKGLGWLINSSHVFLTKSVSASRLHLPPKLFETRHLSKRVHLCRFWTKFFQVVVILLFICIHSSIHSFIHLPLVSRAERCVNQRNEASFPVILNVNTHWVIKGNVEWRCKCSGSVRVCKRLNAKGNKLS